MGPEATRSSSKRDAMKDGGGRGTHASATTEDWDRRGQRLRDYCRTLLPIRAHGGVDIGRERKSRSRRYAMGGGSWVYRPVCRAGLRRVDGGLPEASARWCFQRPRCVGADLGLLERAGRRRRRTTRRRAASSRVLRGWGSTGPPVPFPQRTRLDTRRATSGRLGSSDFHNGNYRKLRRPTSA